MPARASTGDAVDELIALFNTMLDRMNGLVGAMAESLDNVAHDLRTPMARLRGTAERALQSSDPAAHREALADCLEESDRILAMLNTLMDISEAETGVLRLAREPVGLRALVEEAIGLYEHVAEAKRLTVTLAPGDELTASAARDRLRQAFANLLDNAIKYTSEGGRVEIAVAPNGGEAVVTFADTGQGIPPEELPRIWDRLYRGDRSRSERGLGLGLSLVKAYVERARPRLGVHGAAADGTPPVALRRPFFFVMFLQAAGKAERRLKEWRFSQQCTTDLSEREA